jgi:MFS family permease
MLLVPSTIAAGLTFGASWTLMSVTTSELFGLRNFSFNYAAVQLAPILATSVCPQVVGWLFDHAARQQHPHHPDGNVPCTGAACFGASFGMLTALSVVVRCSCYNGDAPVARACALRSMHALLQTRRM